MKIPIDDEENDIAKSSSKNVEANLLDLSPPAPVENATKVFMAFLSLIWWVYFMSPFIDLMFCFS